MADVSVKSAWMLRVLGVTVQGSAGPEPVVIDAPPVARLLPVWVEAKDQVDDAITRMQKALRDEGRANLRLIADAGLNGLTSGESVAMMKALREYDAAPASPAAKKKLATAVKAFRTFLAADEVVSLLEENPFGVVVPFRASFGKALATIIRQIAA